MDEILKELLAVKQSVAILKSIDSKLLELAKASSPKAKVIKAKNLPMYKDPVFMAQLRKEVIEDHNRKIAAKRAREANNNNLL